AREIRVYPQISGSMQVDEGEKFLYSRDYLLNKIATLTGGRVAEELICHTCTTGASNDIEQATNLARSMVTRYGMSDRYGMMALETRGNAYLGGASQLACSDQTAADIDAEVQRIIADAKDKASRIIAQRMDKMHAVADYLLEKETITGEEFMKILNS
ncbi:MAG: cell division protein FtsH, partial [Bacteroidales bacterium]|nr:cell division protein FtsH [Bacteroidales bacterium]